jgi:integrase/recombinase XerD
MKINIRLHLYKSKTHTDGTHPVIIMYTLNGRRIKKTVTRCAEIDWNYKTNRVKTSVKGSANKNRDITYEYSRAESFLHDIKTGVKKLSDLLDENSGITLNEAFDAELVRLEKEFKSGYYDKILAIKKQIPDLLIHVSDIDEKWFKKFIESLEELGNSGNTIKKKIKLMRGVILRYSSAGVTKGVKAISVPTTKTVKQKLNAEELDRLEKLELPEGEQITATRDLFLMQIYLRGVRVGDILQAKSEQFKDGRFTYKADKTDKEQSIKLIPAAQEIVDKYTGRYDCLFPFFTWKPDKSASKFQNERSRLKFKEICTTVVNRHLKVIAVMAEIKKPLSSHIARHTFARMAIDKINNPMVTMELLGHSSLAIHQAYLNDIRKDDVLDAAADDIFS